MSNLKSTQKASNQDQTPSQSPAETTLGLAMKKAGVDTPEGIPSRRNSPDELNLQTSEDMTPQSLCGLQNHQNHPLTYFPPVFHKLSLEDIDVLITLNAFLQDDKIFQWGVDLKESKSTDAESAALSEGDETTLTIHYKGLLEHCYIQDVDKDSSTSKIYPIYASVSSTSSGVGHPPEYSFNLWVVDADWKIILNKKAPLKNLLELLYPDVLNFKLSWGNYLGDSFTVAL